LLCLSRSRDTMRGTIKEETFETSTNYREVRP